MGDTRQQRRGLPGRGRGLPTMRLVTGGAEPLQVPEQADGPFLRATSQPAPVHAGSAALGASLRAGSAALAAAVERDRLAGDVEALRDVVSSRDREIRILRGRIAELEAASVAAAAETERRVEDAERRGRHEALGRARKTVAGHTMPSIVEAGS